VLPAGDLSQHVGRAIPTASRHPPRSHQALQCLQSRPLPRISLAQTTREGSASAGVRYRFCQLAVLARNLEGTTGDLDGILTSVRRRDLEEAAMSDPVTSVRQRLSMPTLPTLDGSEVTLETLRGKKVLLFMWGSW
jgi:hypothetical protein